MKIVSFIYLKNWLLLFKISNSFWDFPIFRLGSSPSFPTLREGEQYLR